MTNIVFNDDYAKGYDALYRDKDYRAEVDLIEAALGLAGRGVKLLDVGCGTGGHAIELARRGHAVTGIDLSAQMLVSARNKAEAELGVTSRPQFQEGDARSFTVGSKGETFDAAVMMFAVIGYLEHNEDVVSALRRIRTHLQLGGLFLCDFWWGPAVLTQRPGERVRIVEDAGDKLLRATRTSLDTSHNTADVHFELFRFSPNKGTVQSSETHRMRYFFGPELELLLQAAGLRLERLSQFMKLGEAPTDDSWNAMLVARAI
jgi:SAM-dependent methyltransferase